MSAALARLRISGDNFASLTPITKFIRKKKITDNIFAW